MKYPVIVAAAGVSLLIMAAEAPYLLPAPKGAPRTVDQAVGRILDGGWLKEADRDWILRSPKSICIDLHFTLGGAIRNGFGLWGNNLALMASCRRLHPDDCSGVIIQAMWRKLRQQADPALVKKLDAQFSRLQAIKIQPADFANLTLGDALARLQQRINQQTDVPSGKSASNMQIKLVGTADSRSPLVGFSETDHETLSLEEFLGLLAFRNGCRVRNDPPVVELVFNRRSP